MNESLTFIYTVSILLHSCLKHPNAPKLKLSKRNRIFLISVHTEQVFVFRNVIRNVKKPFKGGHV